MESNSFINHFYRQDITEQQCDISFAERQWGNFLKGDTDIDNFDELNKRDKDLINYLCFFRRAIIDKLIKEGSEEDINGYKLAVDLGFTK